MGGAINTRQTHVTYADAELRIAGALPWRDFVAPTRNVRHGITVSAAQVDAHNAARTEPNWRAWVEGLDPSELDKNGEVKEQRRLGRYVLPDGTVTWYQRDTARATGTHATDDPADELSLEQVTAPVNGVPATGIQANEDIEAFTFITASGEPNQAAWPTGNYRCQLDVISVGAGLSYGLRDLGASEGHFARVDSGLTTDLETKQQAEAVFTGTGLKLATTGSVSWTAGSAGDRLEVLIAVQRDGVGHGNQSIVLDVNTVDSFVDAPFNGVQLLAATITGQSALTAALAVEKTLDATITAQSTVAAALAVEKTLGATVAGQSALTSALVCERGLDATVTGQSAVAAALVAERQLAALVAAIGALAANLNADWALDATVTAQSQVTGDLMPNVPLRATVTGLSTVAASLAVEKTLDATVTGQSALTAALSVEKTLSSTSAGQSALAVALDVEHTLDGTTGGQSTVAAAVAVLKPLGASASAQSALTAAVVAERGLVATVTALSTLDAALIRVHPLAATIAALSALTADLGDFDEMTATIAAQSSLSAVLDLVPSIASPDTRAEVVIHKTATEAMVESTVADVLVQNTTVEVKTNE
jgi:hypothetical protein